MICIFSTAGDQTTTDVLRWLRGLGARDVVRINADAPLEECSLVEASLHNIVFQVQGRTIGIDEISAAWYRKGRYWLCGIPSARRRTNEARDVGENLSRELQTKFRTEAAVIADFVHSRIAGRVPTLGAPDAWRLNKLRVLEAAHLVGLPVPDFVVSSSRDLLLSKLSAGPLVTKATSDGLYLFDQSAGEGYFTYTELVAREQLQLYPKVVMPSFAQSFVQKRFDVRVFVLADEFFSMAILSQRDSQTKIDFRKYNEDAPNRTVPYVLPDETKGKLRQLFCELRLNTGSVDIAVGPDDTHYFLEVNPVGQFGMMSESCNYNLERKVAEHLLRHAD